MQLSIVRSACLEILEIWGICFCMPQKLGWCASEIVLKKIENLLFSQKRDQLYAINIRYGTVYHFSLCITLRSGGARTDRWRVRILSFFLENFGYISLESNCIRIMVSQWFWDEFAITDSSISWWISAENHQADRLIDVDFASEDSFWEFTNSGVWPSIMTTIVDWVMTLGFLEKNGVGKKKYHGQDFSEGSKLWRFLTFFSAMVQIQVLDLHAIGMRLSCSTIGPAGRGIWWDKKCLKGIDWGG